jgi:hypothetical protein
MAHGERRAAQAGGRAKGTDLRANEWAGPPPPACPRAGHWGREWQTPKNHTSGSWRARARVRVGVRTRATGTGGTHAGPPGKQGSRAGHANTQATSRCAARRNTALQAQRPRTHTHPPPTPRPMRATRKRPAGSGDTSGSVAPHIQQCVAGRSICANGACTSHLTGRHAPGQRVAYEPWKQSLETATTMIMVRQLHAPAIQAHAPVEPSAG